MSEIIRSHKIRLRPTEEQKQHLFRAFRASRYAWNWGKEILNAEYDINQVMYRDIKKRNEFTNARYALKKLYRKSGKPTWAVDVGSVDDSVFEDLQRAISRFFDIQKGKVVLPGKVKHCRYCNTRNYIKTTGAYWTCQGCGANFKIRGDGRRRGWPNWRSLKKHNSFRQTNINLKLDGPYIRYNAKVGYIRMCETLRFDGKIMNATFSYDGRWFWTSVQVKMEKPEMKPSSQIAGIDLGIKYLAVTSDGELIENPKSYYRAQAKLRRLQRKLDRQRRVNNPDCYRADGTTIKGKRPRNWSKQMERTQQKINNLHTRIKNLRRNAQHQLTARTAKTYGLIIIEDLNVNGMLKNKKLAKAIADAGFHEIRRQFEYKADFYNGMVGVVDTWFPSSKLCSNCGEKKLDLSLNDREWTCDCCGQQNERDLNAAINLKNEGIRLFVNPEFIQPGGSPAVQHNRKPSSVSTVGYEIFTT